MVVPAAKAAEQENNPLEQEQEEPKNSFLLLKNILIPIKQIYFIVRSLPQTLNANIPLQFLNISFILIPWKPKQNRMER